MQNFSMIYGSQTFKGSSGKVNVFAMLGDGSHRKEFPDKMYKKVQSQRIHAGLTETDTHGMFYPTTYEGEDGGVLAIKASATRNGTPWADGMMFVCLRESAPLVKIEVTLPQHRQAAHDRLVAFSGRGDIVFKGELHEHGIVLFNNELRNYFIQEELDELFEVTTLLEGTAKPKMVTIRTPKGETKIIEEPRQAGRRLRIRR